MQRRRLSDQALILNSILDVKKEMKARVGRGAKLDSFEIYGVVQRLCNLYSILDVERIMGIVEAADTRKEYKGRKVA